jgi:predicted TIM-barrel fold metal-dependent hydrolase
MDYRVKAGELIKDSIDYHIHSGPDIFPRLLNDVEIARKAKDAGMRAILLKSHIECTASRAKIATFVVDEFPVFGAIALNYSVGGLNPEAVRNAIRLGAKQVYMPTIHAAHYLKEVDSVPMFAQILKGGMKGLSILNGNGNVTNEVIEIIDLIAEADIVLATGHISIEEAMVLVETAHKRGVKKIVVTHPTSPMENYTIDEMKEILGKGATMLEHVVNDTTHQMKNPISPSVIGDAIKLIGPKNTIMSTDSGQIINPEPVKSLENFIYLMLNEGISEEDIKLMIRDNPAKMLDI